MFSSLRFAARSLLRSPGLHPARHHHPRARHRREHRDVQRPQFDPAETASLSAERATAADRPRDARRTPRDAFRRPTFSICSAKCKAYGEIGAYTLGDTSLSEPGQPAEMVRALRITSNFFPVLRVQPQLGRDFLPREDLPGNDRVVIISQRCWQQRFGGRADVIGRVIRVDGEPHEILGVLPAWFNDWRHLGPFDFFRPLVFDQQKSADRRSTLVRPIGRRADQALARGGGRFYCQLRRAPRGGLP